VRNQPCSVSVKAQQLQKSGTCCTTMVQDDSLVLGLTSGTVTVTVGMTGFFRRGTTSVGRLVRSGMARDSLLSVLLPKGRLNTAGEGAAQQALSCRGRLFDKSAARMSGADFAKTAHLHIDNKTNVQHRSCCCFTSCT
jgi:hypothetical protein